MASAAPSWEKEPWNRVRIPTPGSLSTVAVEDKDGVIGSYIKAVIKECHSVRMSLMRRRLDTETGVLREILYSNHNKLCHHKPYLALKQVEQCLKKMNRVNMEGSIQDLFELCPKEDKLENAKKYIIPSQPVLEFVLMKILGTCKLILRLLDCCCKAFLLSVKHLCLEEFIILNTVIIGLVSRVWVLYKYALKKLVSLYKPLFRLLQEVSRIQPMPYFKNFTFPAELKEFLGEAYLDVIKKKVEAKGVTKLLNKLFLAKEKSNKPVEKIALEGPQKPKQMKIKITENVDIGKAVKKRKTYRETSSGFDLKAFCKRPKHKATMDTRSKPVCSERRVQKATGSSQLLVGSSHAKKLVLSIREAQSFTQLSEEIQTAIFWCRRKKLKHKATFLGNKLLKSNRLKHVEAQGCSLPKKLNCIKTSICNFLLHGSGNMSSKCHLRRISSQNKFIKQQRKPQRKLQHTVLKEIQQFIHQTEKAVTEEDAKRTFSDLTVHRPELASKKSQPLDDRNANLSENCNGAVRSPTLALAKEKNTMSETVGDTDDIDDIFSSLGV
ncbi:nucleolus and neural progenitor protein [Trichosurus vulpecula]|uniref:nucleolus and neural progenitor protein n=1 Tax=Trichosurus vulpecula TaxID=9337 RepID=UPI00186B38EE|nr:nucleolus and neural progenitor protein [Trichosurus vulpecula]